jgi:hypothetical protein
VELRGFEPLAFSLRRLPSANARSDGVLKQQLVVHAVRGAAPRGHNGGTKPVVHVPSTVGARVVARGLPKALWLAHASMPEDRKVGGSPPPRPPPKPHVKPGHFLLSGPGRREPERSAEPRSRAAAPSPVLLARRRRRAGTQAPVDGELGARPVAASVRQQVADRCGHVLRIALAPPGRAANTLTARHPAQRPRAWRWCRAGRH